MYKVFVNERPLILTNKLSETANGKYFLLNDEAIQEAISALSKKKIKKAYIYHPNYEELLKKFTKNIPLEVAAGGVVTNDLGKVLFIYRNDKWDLPKGKAEKKETIEETAIREVAEETGVDGLKIVKPLPVTYHVFKRNGKSKLKITHWFEMYSDFEDELQPQINEGITKVEWLNEKAAKQALSNSYANIKLLF